MINVFLVAVFHPEIINDEGETVGTPVVSPVTWGDLALGVPCFVESLGEEVLCDDACLGKPIHSTSYFTKYIAIFINLVLEAVFFDDVFWKQLQFHAEVFIPIHGSHEVEVLDVDCHELASGCGDDTVEQ